MTVTAVTTSISTVTERATSVTSVTGGGVSTALGLLDEAGGPVLDEAASFIFSEAGG